VHAEARACAQSAERRAALERARRGVRIARVHVVRE
jgi:hypothetical protein